MTEKSKIIILKKPEKAQFFVWEPIEGFNLEPKFLWHLLLSIKKSKFQKGIKIG
jgi:hypothetical protein